MRVAIFSSKNYDHHSIEKENKHYGHDLIFLNERLTRKTAPKAKGSQAVCIFVNDEADAEVLEILAELGIKLIALRCAGYNNVDLETAKKLNLKVVRVPAYSPYSVAEYAVGMLLTLNRQISRGLHRVRDNNFSLEGLIGLDIHKKTVGIIGVGHIGSVFAHIMKHGFGANVIAYAPRPKPEQAEKIGFQHVSLEELIETSDIISLHCPLTPENHYMINKNTLAKAKKGFYLINTSRGGLVDTKAVIHALKSKHLGGYAADVYEEEGPLFFENHADDIIDDDILERLISFPNVVFTGHQAFLTKEALSNIAHSILQDISDAEAGKKLPDALV
ncbi:MAG: 2-hydroxyacid dehydrogenase [Zymomonas mobilis subsp. pomaceae]|uniref:D-isomer specific 2-hydroxyacid dehydrogenase NAD-binding protein n=1 Tax=Zymomonas mobilis subsp. pomaceae (strain ATCC 29192 / DSM 22645 / JCM 10191 / CCUG 17912 / NBRC 13757 / NCIMB 11200 / NRRL B-4491 / Barker I) TaxID=579138 RepID=F8ET86_ZYMMT|nr:2-hydroxyacid dehydrogenase [Zymomonas mobilis]AEI36976.1 D-isomer specific 2-hydroxyacid dehydrogenase NAD-binding protein [Zymomonas mobilis subsp. pomaceae ATCC 29192]MDX5948349.1 2-hydroxyacid dehydrogenase [Zymomonas mobilis subsp. pomaceae]GEB89104.1 lactate dehydrogenase [Zymomonas mobilis subsp. pomaceae]